MTEQAAPDFYTNSGPLIRVTAPLLVKQLQEKIKELEDLARSMDPFELSQKIDLKLEKIFKMSSKSPPHIFNLRSLRTPLRYKCYSRKEVRRRKIMARAQEQTFKQVA